MSNIVTLTEDYPNLESGSWDSYFMVALLALFNDQSVDQFCDCCQVLRKLLPYPCLAFWPFALLFSSRLPSRFWAPLFALLSCTTWCSLERGPACVRECARDNSSGSSSWRLHSSSAVSLLRIEFDSKSCFCRKL